MDFTRSKLNKPPVVLDFVPIYWEPFTNSGERLIALIAVKSNLNTSITIVPRAHTLLSLSKLTTLLGSVRGKSAFGILSQSETFLTQRLLAGLELSEANPPFVGFSLGEIKQCKGWSVDQALHAAVNSISIFGTTIDLNSDGGTPSSHIARTNKFLKDMKKKSELKNPDYKLRFDKVFPTANLTTKFTIDYAHEKMLMQLTSLPSRVVPLQAAIQEAESKILRLETVSKMDDLSNWEPQLFINTESLHVEKETDQRSAAESFLEECRYFSESRKFKLVQVESSDRALEILLD